MQVSVKLHSILRDYLPPEAKGKSTLDLAAGATVGDLLSILKINRNCMIMVNNDDITDVDQVLQEGDHVEMFTALGGGA